MGATKLMTAAGGGITLDAASTASDKTITLPAETGTMALTSQLNGFRNRIINGAFQFWQRGTSFTPNSVIYGADRFASYKSGASAGDYARSTDVPSGSGFIYSGYFNNADIRHAVELPVAGNAGEFVTGSTWTVSFWAKIGSGTASSAVGLGFADGTTAGNFGRWGSDQTFNLTTTWQYFTKTFTVSGSPVGSNACVLLYFGAVTGFYITGVQLEKGTVATSFDYRPYGTELALCQRYYQISRSAGANYSYLSNWGSNANTVTNRSTFPLKASMRVAPTSVDFSNVAVDDNGTAPAVTALVIYSTSNPDSVALAATVASGLTQFRPAVLTNGVGAGYIGISAEL